ncbi:hypothetical protein H9X86_00820 [Pseudoflavonifractor capillosus]|uniref:glycoside hydrolase family 3 N-terminal domain-containing protein n=1 Tax=Pseudoflavonifractor capillosus TaxID=106588 RepID=UPI00195E6390|nr:glycoside hydrolase family 3 N-terminal domain-containing protein [Pseudoflavonifractor capillosus]MBM6895916.1 hypothetical protein [Pseudoflavonifractor capillosus]
MTGIKWKRMLAALCCAFIAISGGCANPSTSSGSSVSQESGIPASQETSETQAPSQMAESAYEPSAPSSSVPESQSKPPESGRPSVAWSSIDDILAGMSLRDKICQMLVLSPELLTGVSGVTAAGETTRQAVDILLCPSNPQAAVSALEEAVALGEISEERINQSVRRILAMKVNRGVLKLEG